MSYDLTRLETSTFEQLVQALAVKLVAPGVSIFGDGRDNGREATFNGPMRYPSGADTDDADPGDDKHWSGQLVMQAKFRKQTQGNRNDQAWALKELKKELDTTFAEGSKRTRPEYYIFATNAILSAAAEGGKDKAEKIASNYPLKGFHLWDCDQIRTYLHTEGDVRRAFNAFLTPADVLATLPMQLQSATPDFTDVIHNFLEKELLADQYAHLRQAGSMADERIPISSVFVDLPARPTADATEGSRGFISFALGLASEKLDRISQGRQQPLAARGAVIEPERGRLVLIGGPGQGKTTVSRMLCQLFRAGILRSQPQGSLTPEAAGTIAQLEAQCAEEGIELPTVPRFPINISLTEFSDRLADESGPSSLLEMVAEVVSRRSARQLQPETFREWLAEQPWLLVLDGLDEVSATGNRSDVLAAIREFWVDATQARSDLMVIATTRPQGYNDDFSPSTYQHLTLQPFSEELALHYGTRLGRALYPDDEPRQELIASRLQSASGEEPAAGLMATPLQVTIMVTLVDLGGEPPKERWKLFSEYYKVTYQRELERDIPASSVLRKHQTDIDVIHRRVALVLQTEVESESHAQARMSKSRFAEIVQTRLREEGHEEADLGEIAQEIVRVTPRLDFLVDLEADEFGFEVRSLQEFMAAEALVSGDSAIVAERLRTIAGTTSWRNVFIFAAGYFFAHDEHLRDTVNTVCGELNDPVDDPLSPILWPGSVLAMDLLADGVTRNKPKFARRLAEHAMRLLARPLASWRLPDALEASTQRVLAEALTRGLGEPGQVRSSSILLLLELDRKGVEWATRILDEQVPESIETTVEIVGSVVDVFGPERPVEGLWLSGRVHAVAGEMGLAELQQSPLGLIDFWDRIPDNGAFMVAQALRDPFRGREVSVVGEELDGGWFSLGVRWMQPNSIALDKALEKDPNTLVVARPAVRVARDFMQEPDAPQLAHQLRVLADQVDPRDWRAVGVLSLWPLSTTIQHAGDDPERLHRLADLAQEGRLGDYGAWKAAEERWRENGVSFEDLDYVPQVDAPFDEKVATRGFPVDDSAGFHQIVGGTEVISLLETWLQSCRSEGLKTRLARWLVYGLEGRGFAGGRSLPAGSLSRYLSEDALRWGDSMSPQFNLRDRESAGYLLVLGLDWSDSLSPEEAAALDRIGKSLRTRAQGKTREGDDDWPMGIAPAALARNWEAGRQTDGLFRILAIGIPTPEGEQLTDGPPTPLPVAAAPEIAARNPGAAGLLALKGPWSPEGVKRAIALMASVWETEPIWLWEAVDAIGGRLEEPEAEQVARELWDAAGSSSSMLVESQNLRGQLDDLCGYLFDMRASGLGEASTWNSLDLFTQPSQPGSAG
jgi:hypothetical protein